MTTMRKLLALLVVAVCEPRNDKKRDSTERGADTDNCIEAGIVCMCDIGGNRQGFRVLLNAAKLISKYDDELLNY